MKSPGPDPATPRRRVVVVDDDITLLALMHRWLASAGYTVQTFSEFETAQAFLASDSPDVLVTDVRLGAFNGLHLVMMAKLRRPELRAVVLTGFDDHVLQHQAVAVGAEFLLKPVSSERLLEAIMPQPAQPAASAL